MVVHRKSDFITSFDRNWVKYRDGFGSCMDDVNNRQIWLGDDCTRDLWIGNKILHRSYQMKGPLQLLVQLTDSNNEAHAIYKRFGLGSVESNYTMYIQGYGGSAGNSLQVHHGMQFTTKDKDNDMDPSQNCALNGRGGWWYNACGDSQLNGNNVGLVAWNTWPATPFTGASMMIKPNIGEVIFH